MSLKEVLERTEKVKPLAENNGVKVVSFEEQRDLAQADILQNPGLGTVKMNPDGSVARTPTRFSAVNLDSYFINRFKSTEDKKLLIVTDYRAIKGQDEGRVYTKRIPAFVIARDAKGKLFLEKLVTVSDDEFIADFTESLSNDLMEKIKPLLEAGVAVTKTSSMPI